MLKVMTRLAAVFFGGVVLLVGTAIASAAEPVKVKVALNWKPEPQFGGFYAAAGIGAFANAGIEAEILPGGSGTPTVQMIDNGRVEFGIVSGDELVSLRAKGGDVVALFAVFQTNPQGIMAHAERGAKTLKELLESPGTVAWQAGLPYVKHFTKQYDLSKLRQVPYQGGLPFLKSEDFAQQCFVTSEPLLAKKQGKAVSTFLVAESGYNPYTTVLVTRGEYLRKNPEVVAAVTKAVAAGWIAYLTDPKPTNDSMRKLNPAMDAATFAESAEAQKPLIATEETKTQGLGAMTVERWKQLIDQLTEYKVIDKPVKPEECFVPLPK